MSDPEDPLGWMSSHGVAELVAQGNKASSLMEECTDVKSQEGSISLKGIFLGRLPKQERRADAKEGSKDPPAKFRIKLVGIKDYIARYQSDHAAAMALLEDEDDKPEEFLNILSPTSFSMKANQSVSKENAISILTGSGDPMDEEEIKARLLRAKNDGYKNLKVYRSDYVISEGDTVVVACFNPKAGNMNPGTLVEIMGTSANSYWGKKTEDWRASLNVETFFVSPDNQENPVDNFRAFGLIDHNLPIYDVSNPPKGTLVVPFETTIDKPDFDVAGSFSKMNNSSDVERFSYKNKAEQELPRMQLSMFKRTWDDRGNKFGWSQAITTKLFSWKNDKGSDDRLVLKFGIPDVAQWKEFMPFNPVPVVCVATVDEKTTSALPDPKAGLVLQTWEYFPDLQGWLLKCCPRVSYEFAMSKLPKSRSPGRIELNNPNKPNLMNNQAGEKQGGDWVMTGPVVALSSWDGYIDDVKSAGCEVRAFINADIPLGKRLLFENMSIEDTLKVLECAPDAAIQLEEPPKFYFYAVKPKEDNLRVQVMDTGDDEVEAPPILAPAPSPKKRKSNVPEEEEEEEEEEAPAPKKKKKRGKVAIKPKSKK